MSKHHLQVINNEQVSERIDSSLFQHDMNYTDIPQEYHQLPENDKCVFDAIRHNGHVTRSDLVNICSLPRTTIYDALGEPTWTQLFKARIKPYLFRKWEFLTELDVVKDVFHLFLD